ncbi:MAG: SpoIIE family protein phosphatase [Candidatus Velamenicoccus archaeovorus]
MTTDLLDWGVATRALPGEPESGDRHVIAGFPGGALVAAIDGLGHGPDASSAAVAAVAVLAEQPQRSVTALVQRCHVSLRGTRGVVMTVASFEAREHTMTWLSVGNVEAFLFHGDRGRGRRESVFQRGGVVGYQLPPLRADVVPVAPGDVLVMATDGIRGDFTEDVSPAMEPQTMATGILARSFKGTDDALVVVARYVGRGEGP